MRDAGGGWRTKNLPPATGLPVYSSPLPFPIQQMIEAEEDDDSEDAEDEQNLPKAGIDEDDEVQARPDQPEGDEDGDGEKDGAGTGTHGRDCSMVGPGAKEHHPGIGPTCQHPLFMTQCVMTGCSAAGESDAAQRIAQHCRKAGSSGLSGSKNCFSFSGGRP